LAGLLSLTWSAPARAAHVDCRTSAYGCLIYGAWPLTGGPATGERVVVLGDSLIQLLGSTLLDQLVANGFRAHTNGAGGSSYWHWNNGFVVDHQDIGNIAAAHDAEHVVLALGANDASALSSGRVSHQTLANEILWGMTRADAGSSGCVILIQPAGHGTASYNTAAGQVRNIMHLLKTSRNNALGTTRFVTADWHAQSLGHEGWFGGPTDIHHSPEGMLQYRNFITVYLAAARNGSLGC
jgi:hypothetical protein